MKLTEQIVFLIFNARRRRGFPGSRDALIHASGRLYHSLNYSRDSLSGLVSSLLRVPPIDLFPARRLSREKLGLPDQPSATSSRLVLVDTKDGLCYRWRSLFT